MKGFLLIAASAPLLVAAAPYSNDKLANGFAQFVAMGRDLTPLMSTDIPSDTAENLALLKGCRVKEVDSLAVSKYVGYGIQWKCHKLPKGVHTAAVIKIADGKIYEILMSDVTNG